MATWRARPTASLASETGFEGNGMTHMTGFFPSVSLQVNFDLLFAPVEGQWRLFGIGVDMGQAAPAAPETLQPPK